MANIADIMRRATAAFSRGDMGNALREARLAEQADSRNAAIIQFIGVVLCNDGRPAEGLAEFRRAIALSPRDTALRFNAAKAALDSGDTEQARKLCQPIATLPDGQRLMAEIARAGVGVEAALDHLARLAAANPRDHKVLNNLGNALNDAGRPADAVRVLSEANRLHPGSSQILLNLGRALAASGNHPQALEIFQAAATAKGDDAEVRLELGKSLLRQADHESALKQLADAARLGSKDVQVYVLIGVCFAALEQRDDAERAFRTVLKMAPDSARAHVNLAILLEQENRVEELGALAIEARKHMTPGPDLDYIEALVLQRAGKFAEALALAERSSTDSLDPMVRAQFIGQTADRLGEFDKAFAAFSEMNALMAQTPNAAGFDGTEHHAMVQSRIAVLTPAWGTAWQPLEIADTRPSPAFLGGFLRSGTTLLDTILMSHPATEVREEEPMIAVLEEAGGPIERVPRMGAEGLANMRAAYFAELDARAKRDDAKLIIDKYPLFTLRAGWIHRAFPDAKMVFALRHPCDVVLSSWMQNFRVTRAMASFLSLENAARDYAAVMEHWSRARELLPLKVHTVRYEDMVEDLEGELRPLLQFLELEWDDNLLQYQKTAKDRGYIRTPSYSQVTEGIYRRSKGRWENYREHIAPVLDVLAPWAVQFGYGDPRE